MRSLGQAGFSLIELLVSMTIFTIVVTLSTGTLLVLIDANNKAQNMQAVMSNVTFALDSMTREIRTGYNYVCQTTRRAAEDDDATSDCASGGTYLSIVESGDSLTAGTGGNRIGYDFERNHYGTGQGAIMRRLGTGDWYPITSSNIAIADLEFVVTGTDTGAADASQPTVTIYISGEAGEIEGLDTSFHLEASVTQRSLDL